MNYTCLTGFQIAPDLLQICSKFPNLNWKNNKDLTSLQDAIVTKFFQKFIFYFLT